MIKAPTVCMIDDVRLSDPFTTGRLTYSNLALANLQYEQADSALLREVWRADENSIQEIGQARNAAHAYIARTAAQVIAAPTPAQHDLWAARFTRASIELYDAPDPQEARRLIHEKQQQLLGLLSCSTVDRHAVDYLLEFYSSVAGEPDTTALETNPEMWNEISQVMHDRYGAVLALADTAAAGRDMLTTKEYSTVCRDAVKWLAQHANPEWGAWSIVEKPGGFATYQETKELIVGTNASGSIERLRLKTLVGHEILTHMLRSVSASAYANPNMQLGLAGFDTFEEGLATLIGWAVAGRGTPHSAAGFSDIALALGTIDGQPRRRDELLRVSLARMTIYEQLARGGVYLDSTQLQKVELHARQMVNRIFRGGRGDNFGQVQAVLTKDAMYHHGYTRACAYIERQRAKGISMERILDYLMICGFDPEIDIHAEHVFQQTGQRL